MCEASASMSSPLLLDIGDFERDILLLEKTNRELKEMIANGEIDNEDEDAVADVRYIIVENEFAIDIKLKSRKETRDLIPELSKVEDVFHLERTLGLQFEHMQISSDTAHIHNKICQANKNKAPIIVGVKEEEDGIFL